MPVDRYEVTMAYRLLLGREPESEAVVEGHAAAYSDLDALRAAFMGSSEFRTLVDTTPLFVEDKWVLAEIENGLRLWVNLRDPGVSRAALTSRWEHAVTNYILDHIKAGDVFLDIGANIGWFTILVADALRKLGGGGKVHAFEPQKLIYEKMCQSVAENGLEQYVNTYNIALSDAPGKMVMELDHLNPAVARLAPHGTSQGSETVDLVRLDEMNIDGRIAFIKTDAEGAEGRILKGAWQVIESDRPLIVAELNKNCLPMVSDITADDLLGSMKARGYQCTLLEDNGSNDKQVESADEVLDDAANVIFTYRSQSG